MPPTLSLSTIRYGSRVKWSNSGKWGVPSPTSQGNGYLIGSLQLPLTTVANFTILHNCSSWPTVIEGGSKTPFSIGQHITTKPMKQSLSIYIYIYIYIYMFVNDVCEFVCVCCLRANVKCNCYKNIMVYLSIHVK